MRKKEKRQTDRQERREEEEGSEFMGTAEREKRKFIKKLV